VQTKVTITMTITWLVLDDW